MKPLIKILATCLIGMLASNCFAQTDTSRNEKEGFKIDLSFLNNGVYLGRTDTVTTPTLSPSLSYAFKSGIYFSGNLDIITNRTKNKLDGGAIEAGYDYTRAKNLEASVSFTKLFYNANSTQVSSTISSVINVYADYDVAHIVTPGISINYNIAKSGYKSDWVFNPGISHEFEIDGIFSNDDELLITPRFELNAGSQNYFAGYQQKKGRLTKKGAALATAIINDYENSLGNFKLLDYEIAAPLEYKTGLFVFQFKPIYAFAQNSLPQSNPAQQAITNQIETSSHYKTSIFYFEAGLTLKFKL